MSDDAGGKPALSDGLGLVERLRLIAAWHTPGGPTPSVKPDKMATCHEAAAEIERLRAALRKANDQAERFEMHWYLAKEDADRYTFAKTLEGQVVTMETVKVRGGAALDQALDDAMAEDADARNEAWYGA